MLRRLALPAAIALAVSVLAGVGSATTSGVSASGGQLLLAGRAHYFPGINAYSATTDWAVNSGCGAMIGNLDDVFGAIPPGSLVRTWAFQALGFNKSTHAIDLTAIDRVVQAAASNGDYLILTLSDQAGTCDDGHWHDQAWYDGGYKKTYNDDGRGLALSMSYFDWVKTVVARYASDPVVAVYEPVNEPEAANCPSGYTGGSCYGHTTCPSGATTSLRTFADSIGSTIKAIDADALVSMGVIGSSQCGISGSGYDTVAASPNIDIATYHDYSSATATMPSSLAARLSSAQNLGKALLVEEAGIYASPQGSGCVTVSERATDFKAKSQAVKRAGGDGYLPWNWDASPTSGCTLNIPPGDPILSALKQF